MKKMIFILLLGFLLLAGWFVVGVARGQHWYFTISTSFRDASYFDPYGPYYFEISCKTARKWHGYFLKQIDNSIQTHECAKRVN